MELDRELLKNTIKRNPEGHEKLTGRYYLTSSGIEFICASQPKPVGAKRIPSFSDAEVYKSHKLSQDELAEALAEEFINSLPDR